ncbi:MAG: glycosyltransferase family 87 protein [bacterium]|nr:glycosyltransferase family 87 protein [bacterium]
MPPQKTKKKTATKSQRCPAASNTSAISVAPDNSPTNSPAASAVSSLKWPFLITALLLAAAILAGLYSYPRHPLYQGDITKLGGGYDYFYYYATVHALQDKLANIYAPAEMQEYSRQLSGERQWSVSDNHLPPFYILYLPLSKRSFSQGYYIHLWANLNIIWLAVLALSLSLLPSRRQAYLFLLLFMGATVTLGPAVDNIYLGQIGFAFAGLLALIFIFDRINYGAPAGICLALAILCKMYPALLLVYFALKHRWQTLKWTAYTLLAMGLAAGLQWGFSRYSDYWQYLSQTMNYDSTVGNQALIGVIANACPYLSPAELKIVHFCLMALALSGLSWFSWNLPRRPAHASSGLLEFSVWVTAATIVSPISWSHHHIFLILPLLAFLGIACSPASISISSSSADQPAPEPSAATAEAATPPAAPDSSEFAAKRSPAASANAALTPNPIKANWNAPIEITSRKRGLAIAGITLIVLLWCFEGETVTNMGVKALHYQFCAYHLGGISLLAILAAEIAALKQL